MLIGKEQPRLLAVLAALILTLPAEALERRTFYSADKSQSFAATLEGFDQKKKVVTVVFPSGDKKSFSLDILSKECQEYVLANAELLLIAKSVKLGFEEVREKSGDDAFATGYAIEVSNTGTKPIDEVTLKYTLHYRQGDLNKGGTVAKTKSGTLRTEKLFSKDRLHVQTSKVDIVRKFRPPQGG